MKKKLIAAIACLCALVMLAGCDAVTDLVGGGDGTKEGKIGDKMKTYFFDFTVDSAEVLESYAGYIPAEGFLLDVVITTTNTFGEDLEMVDYDYQLQWDERTNPDTYSVVLDALDDDCAPAYNTLANGESMTYHYLFEIPDDVTDFEICYAEFFIESDGTESEGDYHYVALST